MKKHSETVARTAVLIALALLLSYIESLLSFNVGVPGVKVGFTNIVCLFVMYRFGSVEALVVNVARVLLMALLFGNALSAIYALSGAVLAFVTMVLLKKSKLFGVVGVSAAGAVMHNMGQLAAAALLGGTAYVLSYAPVLVAAGTVFGGITGVICAVCLKKIPEKNSFFNEKA